MADDADFSFNVLEGGGQTRAGELDLMSVLDGLQAGRGEHPDIDQ